MIASVGSVSVRLLLLAGPIVALFFGTAYPAHATKRALLIGISAYKPLPALDNPRYDITHIAAKLSANYTVTVVKDPDTGLVALNDAITAFEQSIQPGDEVVVYYSGHGVSVAGADMLAPADSPPSNKIGLNYHALATRLISLRSTMQDIANHEPKIQVWIVDACREDPYAESGKGEVSKGGLAPLGSDDVPGDTFIIFAADYNQVAQDKLPDEAANTGLGSPFSRTFVNLFDTWKDRDITQYAGHVRQEVWKLVSPYPQKVMFENGIFDTDAGWCFMTCSAGARPVYCTPSPNQVGDELKVDCVASRSEAEELARRYYKLLKRYPVSTDRNDLAEQAHALIRQGRFDDARKVLEEVSDQQKLSVKKAAATQFDLGELAMLQSTPTAALPYYSEALRLNPNNPVYLSALASAEFKLRQYAAAEGTWEKARDLYRGASGKGQADHQDDLANILNSLGGIYQRTGRYPLAQKAFADALAIYQTLAKTDQTKYLAPIAWTENNLGSLNRDTGDAAKARDAFTDALAKFRELAGKNPGSYRSDVAETLNNLGGIEAFYKDYPNAVVHLSEASRTYRDLDREYPNVFVANVAWTLNNLAGASAHDCSPGKKCAALDLFAEAVDKYRALEANDADTYKADVAWTYNNRGAINLQLMSPADARQDFNKALVRYKVLVKNPNDTHGCDLARTWVNLGRISQTEPDTAGKPQASGKGRATVEFGNALAALQNVQEHDRRACRSDLAWTLNWLGINDTASGNNAKAEQDLKASLALYDELNVPPSKLFEAEIAWAYVGLGNVYTNSNRRREAKAAYNTARERFRSLANAGSAGYADEIASLTSTINGLR